MQIRRFAKWAAIMVLVVATTVAVAALVLLSRASVQTTPHGAVTRLRLHLPAGRDIAFPVNVASRGARMPGFLDGPIVRRGKDGRWTAAWYCEDRALASDLAPGAQALRIKCAGKQHVFPLYTPRLPAAVAPMPGRVAVLSDLEGNIAFLDQALRRLGVVNESGHWAYGNGHLVILGDSVDRGRDVFAVLWRLHGLARQAAASGGALHVLLGNHDQYMLRTNPSRANPDHLHALNAMGGYRDAFAADTMIGEWLRQQPVALKLGDVVFVHAGISPQVVRTGLSIPQLNAAMRDYWNDDDHAPSPALDAVLAPTGVTQYRGFFRGQEGRYPRATDAEVAAALDHFDARLVVVGHTIVPAIAAQRGGRVYPVDVNNNESAPEALVFEQGKPTVVDIGVPRNIEHPDPVLREFSLLDHDDRSLLLDMARDLRRLSRLPYPY